MLFVSALFVLVVVIAHGAGDHQAARPAAAADPAANEQPSELVLFVSALFVLVIVIADGTGEQEPASPASAGHTAADQEPG